MSKYYSYDILLKKKNKEKRRIKTVLKVLLYTSCLIIFILIFYGIIVKTNLFLNIFKIPHIYLENNSTIPDEIIYRQLNKEQTTIFGCKKVFFQLQKKYPEIKEIKIVSLPIKVLKVKIYSFSPIVYKMGNDNTVWFLSEHGNWYKIYDDKKINLSKLCFIEGDVESSVIKMIYKKFSEVSVWDKVKKIRKENNKYIVEFYDDNGYKLSFVITKEFKDVKKETLAKLLKYSFLKDTKIYTQLLTYGKVYIE
jgi:cell division septal protein FtsQ